MLEDSGYGRGLHQLFGFGVPDDETAEADIEAIVRRIRPSDTALTDSQVKQIVELAGGNPLTAIHGALLMLEGDGLKHTLADIVEERLSRLDKEIRRVFEAICVLGTAVPTDLLDDLLQDEQLYLALERLLLRSGHKVTAKMVFKEIIGTSTRFPELTHQVGQYLAECKSIPNPSFEQ